MTTKPLVAIVGRPNVGKSTFFNKIAGHRVAIVEDTPGVTRDRIYADVEWTGREFTLIDTGGIDPRSDDVLLSQMRRQAEIAIEMADVICFFCDARDGLTRDDEEVASLLRRTRKPVILVVNKLDYAGLNDVLYEYYALGLGDRWAFPPPTCWVWAICWMKSSSFCPPSARMRKRTKTACTKSSWRWWVAPMWAKAA